MNELKEVLYSEIENFRAVGHQFVNGEINMMQFKHSSGGYGVYAHKGGKEFMIRFRIPSGVTNVKQMETVYEIAKKYNLEKIHLTTRQAIQLHGLKIDEVCDIMKEALDKDIYTRGGGGDFPRNVAVSPLSGVQEEEAFDVTPYALAAGNHFLNKIYKYKLPRKLKVSFSSTKADEAHCTVQDLGFLGVNKDGQKYFQVYIGGGIGQNPKKAVKYPELIDTKDVLYHLDAVTNLFMSEGDYKNRNKARIRYILDRMGEEQFISEYQKHLDIAKNKGGLDLQIEENVINKKGIKIDINNKNVFAQKQEGLYSVYLHPTGGQLYLKHLKELLDVLNKFEDVEIRLTMNEGVYFRNLNGEEAKEILAMTEVFGANTEFEQSVSCIGGAICQMGLCDSQGLLISIMDYFKEKDFKKDILPSIRISGCVNSCGIHQVGTIAFMGKKKRVDNVVQECFSLFVDGSFAVDTVNFGTCYGEILATKIPEFLYELAIALDSKSVKFDEFIKGYKEEFEGIVNRYLV